MKKFALLVLCCLSSSAYAVNLQSRLGVPLGITANDAECGPGPDASATVAQVASFDAILFQWAQMRDPGFKQVIIDRAARDRRAGLKVMLGMSPTALAAPRTDLDVPSAVMSACGLVHYSGCTLNANTASFSNTCLRNQFIADATTYAAAIQPDYFHLATEINFLLLRIDACPGDVEFASMGTLYQAAYPAVKAVSPNSQLFVSFEYELQKAIDRADPGNINANWDATLGAFRGGGAVSLLDVVGFTTYPSSNGLLTGDYTTPASIPADFYAAAAEHLHPGERAAFSEVGWPTIQSGSEASQSEYLNRLPELMSVANPALVTLALLHDTTLFGSSSLGTVGVRNCNGTPKAGWSVLTGSPSGGASASDPLGSIHIYPNPLRPSQGHTLMFFTDLPAGARLRIYTLAGEQVQDISADPFGSAHWDGANKSGQRVASGVYMVYVQGGGASKTLKVAVQR